MGTMRLLLAGILSTALTLAAAAPAAAGVKNIWPHQLRPYYAGSVTTIAAGEAAARNAYSWVSATSASAATFMAPVKLKPGTRITGFSMKASAQGSCQIVARLYRRMFDGDEEEMAGIDTTVTTSGKIWFDAPRIEIPAVRGRYVYWVKLSIQNGSGFVFGLRVRYR